MINTAISNHHCSKNVIFPPPYFIIIYLLLQVWNKIIADNQHNLGKLVTVKVHLHGVNGDLNVYALFAMNALIVRMVYCELGSC